MPEGYPTLGRCAPAAGCRCRASGCRFRASSRRAATIRSAGFDRVAELARAWGGRLVDLGEVGHLNPASGFGDWPQAEDSRSHELATAGSAPGRLAAHTKRRQKETAMAKAIRFHETGGPEVLKLENGRGRRARPGPGARAPHLRRGQLHRHLLPHRPLSAAAAQRARLGRGRRGRGGRPGRHRHPRRRPRRLSARAAGRLFGRARDAGRRADPAARRRLGPHRRDADDEGHDGAVPVPAGLSAQGRRDDPLPRGRRRRRPDRLPVGAGARRHHDRHRQLRREGRDRARRTAARTPSSPRARTSPSGCARSPTARACRWSTTRSARTR